jgi:hypothetical protein
MVANPTAATKRTMKDPKIKIPAVMLNPPTVAVRPKRASSPFEAGNAVNDDAGGGFGSVPVMCDDRGREGEGMIECDSAGPLLVPVGIGVTGRLIDEVVKVGFSVVVVVVFLVVVGFSLVVGLG